MYWVKHLGQQMDRKILGSMVRAEMAVRESCGNDRWMLDCGVDWDVADCPNLIAM